MADAAVYPAGQLIAIRGTVMLTIFGSLSLVLPSVSMRMVFRDRNLHAARAGLIGLSALLFLGGLSAMPLANAVALSFSSPLVVAALSGPMLGERVDPRGWATIVVGFLGALLVLNPSLEHYGPASVLPFLAGVTTALSDLLTRRMSAHETSVSLATSTAFGTAVVGIGTVGFGWNSFDLPALTVIVVASIFFLLAYVFIAHAFRMAPASFVTPFRYTALVWSLLLGFLFWRQVPDATVLAGAALVVACGVYLVRTNGRA